MFEKLFSPEAVQQALDVLKTEIPFGIWETVYVTVLATVLAAVIGLHNIPEGMAISAPMVAGGERRWRAAGLAALSGAPTVLGAALGYCLGTLGPTALTLTLSFAAGAMLYVVFGELLPEAASLWKSKLPALAAVLGILVGMLIDG